MAILFAINLSPCPLQSDRGHLKAASDPGLFFISRDTGSMGVWTSGTDIFLSLWGTYVSPRSPGWMAFTQHVGVCCFVAFISVGVLSGAFYWFLSSFTTFITSWAATCVLLCCSKHARCFILLFFLSCGLREGRNALIAAGTGVVIFGHVENIFHNFKGLLDSMTCNLRAKSFSIHFPLLKNYIEAIRWVYGLVTHLSLFDDLVSWNQTLEVSLFSPSQALEAQLNDTTDKALGVLYQMVTATEVLCSLGRQLLALTGLLLVLLGTGLFMKRFLDPCGWKFENIYLTRQFVQLDERERREQRPCVLPLNKQERKKYVVIPSFWLTPKDRRNLGLFFLPVLTHLYIWLLFAAIDYLLYSLIFSMSKHFQSLPGLEMHLKLHRQVGALRPISPAILAACCLFAKDSEHPKEGQCFISFLDPQCLAWSLECRKSPKQVG